MSGAAELIDAALSRATTASELGAFWALDAALALRAADAAAARAAAGEPLSLAGVPVAVKACFDVAGLPTSAGVRELETLPRSDAAVIRRVRRAGGVPLGKTAMDQLAWSTAGRAPGYPAVRNPVDRRRSPGGSSAGSAVAVAAGIVPLALGTDTAGSVRIPASYCGVVGLKPARRALPRAGCLSIAPSAESPGVLARSVADCRRGYEAMRSRRLERGDASAPLRIGRLDDLFDAAAAPVAGACDDALAAIEGRHVIEATQLAWRPAGFGRLLAADLAATWGEQIASDPGRFTAAILASAQLGRQVGEAERRDILASFQRARRSLGRRLGALSVVASPTVPHAVPRAGEESVDDSTRFTRPFNALGWAAISIPAGRDGDGLPVGLQLAAPPAHLGALWRAAEAIESAIAERGR